MAEAVEVKSQEQVPLIIETDVLVVGGGLAGLAAACDLAGAGRKVALVEAEIFLGYEIGAWQRPWVQWRPADAALLEEWFPLETGAVSQGDYVPLHMDRTKLRFEDRLLSRGVRLLYGSRPVGFRREGDRWLVVFGNKCGRQAVACHHIVDATETGVMAYLAGRGAAPVSEVARRTIEFTGVSRRGVERVMVPASLSVMGDSVRVYPGAFSDSHVYVDIEMATGSSAPRSSASDTEVELGARRKSMEVAEYLAHNVPEFSKAKIGLGSLMTMRGSDFDPVAALKVGGELAKAVLAGEVKSGECHWVSAAGKRSFELPDRGPAVKATGAVCAHREASEFAATWAGGTVAAPLTALPVLAEAEVLVVGGGTSGAPAAYTAAREGAKVALVEMTSRLGGTGTVGGVCEHWMSTPNEFNDEIDRRVDEWEDRVGYPKEARRWASYRTRSDGSRFFWGSDLHWSIEVKEQVLEELCAQAGVATHFSGLQFGTLVDGNRVLGAAVATPYGPFAALGRITVDATGDGDVAAFAGGENVYGNRRDRLTQWTAIAFYREPGGIGNNHLEAGDVGDVFDYTRFVLTNRRRGRGIHDHGNYVAPRESRHIVGEVTNTLLDQLMLRRYPDTVAVMFSNWDMKGLWFADVVDWGINPPHQDIDVPYRALIPKRLEQLIIAGKAFSLTHDACAAPRMQRDLILLGGAVGLAAAFAIKDGVSPRELEVSKLQRRMVETGNAPERILHYAPASEPDLAALVDGLTGEEPLEWQEMLATEKVTSVSPVIQLCCADSREVAPLLLRALGGAEGKRRLLLARLLLWHRCPEGAEAVAEEIVRQLAETAGLPRRAGDIWWSTGSPEQAIQPEIIFLVNALVRVKDQRVPGIVSEFVERLERAERDYADIPAGIFDYIRMVAMAAERMPSAELVPMVKRLLELPEVRAAACPPELELDHYKERRTYLVLALGRALARCGRKEGLIELAQLLDDPRTLYAKSAHMELRALTGMDHPFSRQAWMGALEEWPGSFEPTPWEGEMS
ncbi:MAG: FAD-dependent oxidoreductase [Armatimonadota bacterium]